jgi:drug/metabolite transporter (DMT)-like permease
VNWIELSFIGGCLQAARNGLSKSLAGKVSPVLNSWSRFTFNLPLSTLLMLIVLFQLGQPTLPLPFFLYCLATAITQLLGNVALVSAFNHANFAETIVLHKLEVVFTAVIGMLFFSETPTLFGWGGITLCGAGVLLMNLGREGGPAGWRRAFHLSTGSLLALSCGLLIVFASFMLKSANLEYVLANPHIGANRFEPAVHTLFHTTWMEVLILTLTILFTRRHEFRLVQTHWKRMTMIGAVSFSGSLCWFWAYSLTLVAYSKAVGQIEAVLAVALALFVWKEREVIRQLPGVALILVGIGMVLLG